MADRIEERDAEIRIPDNVLSSKRYLGFRRKNIIEGLILTLFVILIILMIPFVRRIKIIFCIIVGLSVFILCCIGLHGQSLSELIINFAYNIQLPKIWHMRSINHARSKKKAAKISETNVYTNQSIGEKAFAFAKSKYKEFISSR